MVKKANREYWKKRFEALEDKQYQESEAYYRDVEEQFRKVCNGLTLDIERWYQRLADNNDISLAAAKRLLKKGELDEFLWSVEEYIQKGEENSVDQRWMKELENASARHHISYLEAMKLQVRQYGELLAATMENGLTEYLHKTYSEQYYRAAVEITNGTKVGMNLTRLDEKKIDAAIRYPWASDGKSFSDRIWSNKERLVQKLHTELVQNLIRGESPRTAIDLIAAEMNTSKKNAGRLIMTESAAISSRAHSQCFKELGVKQYEIVATLDSHTSEICREMDGRVFDLKDYEEGLTAPPFHPWCRTTTVPHFDDEFTVGEQRAARDEETGKTVYVPAGMKYEGWKQQYLSSDNDKSKVRRAQYLTRTHKGASDISREKQITDEAISEIPQKVRDKLEEGTVIDIGKIGASQYDYDNDILYVAKKAEKEDIVHEFGHLVENKMMDYEKISQIRRQIIGEVDIWDIKTETFYDNEGNPVEIFLLENDKFVSQYQGRIYAETIWDAFDEDGDFRDELMMEFISEPFWEYIENPEFVKGKCKELYDLIEESVK